MDGKTDEKFQRTSESVHSLAVFFTVLALVSVVLVVLVPAFAFLYVCQSSLLNLEPSAWISLETLANFPMALFYIVIAIAGLIIYADSAFALVMFAFGLILNNVNLGGKRSKKHVPPQEKINVVKEIMEMNNNNNNVWIKPGLKTEIINNHFRDDYMQKRCLSLKKRAISHCV